MPFVMLVVGVSLVPLFCFCFCLGLVFVAQRLPRLGGRGSKLAGFSTSFYLCVLILPLLPFLSS
jgi:hypothetical protein